MKQLKQPMDTEVVSQVLSWRNTFFAGLFGLAFLILASRLGVYLKGSLPLSLMLLVVLLLSMGLGWRFGLGVVGAYLILGVCSIPLLPVPFCHPQFGYLLGLLPAVLVATGALKWFQGKLSWRVLFGGLLATLIVHLAGVCFVYWRVGDWDFQHIIAPFLPGHAVKIAILMIAVPMLQQWRPLYRKSMMPAI